MPVVATVVLTESTAVRYRITELLRKHTLDQVVGWLRDGSAEFHIQSSATFGGGREIEYGALVRLFEAPGGRKTVREVARCEIDVPAGVVRERLVTVLDPGPDPSDEGA